MKTSPPQSHAVKSSDTCQAHHSTRQRASERHQANHRPGSSEPRGPLLQQPGIGPVTATVTLTAWSHLRRIRTEAAFASLANVNPIPASSGNTVRHRINRGKDR